MNRHAWSLVGIAATLGIAFPAFVEMPDTLIWNVTPSAPVGLYEVRPVARLHRTDLVVLEAPPPLESFLTERGYLPPNIPLLKRVVGVPGQTICRIGRTITVDGAVMGEAQERDSFGRPMPVWSGCQRIAPDEVFLMNRDIENSLDGRYFGPVSASSITGLAIALWTDEDGTGRYRWRVSAR
jgi:conjugative transfer signal peptidase TraF